MKLEYLQRCAGGRRHGRRSILSWLTLARNLSAAAQAYPAFLASRKQSHYTCVGSDFSSLLSLLRRHFRWQTPIGVCGMRIESARIAAYQRRIRAAHGAAPLLPRRALLARNAQNEKRFCRYCCCTAHPLLALACLFAITASAKA
jgi:hypothetical protein